MLKVLNYAWGHFLGLLGFPAQRYICFRPYVMPVVVGLCLGITIHMMAAPFLEDGCDMKRPAPRKSPIGIIKLPKTTQKSSLDNENDDFEAHIIKQVPKNTSVDKNAVRPKVPRSRYISTELGIKEKLFVSVLTSAHSIDKLGVAVDKTLSKYMTKVIFFSSEKPYVVPSGLPLVAFGDRHPEMLPVHILRYIKEHYAEAYDFYLFISDRTYLRAEKYYNLVEHISIKDDVFMGVPGYDRNFCALEGGILLSSSVMSQVFSKLDWCTSNIHSDNPSITFGRCVHYASQKLCTPRGGDQTLKFYQLEDFDYDADIDKLKGDTSFNQSLTFYPMPDDISHYKLHRYFCRVDLKDTQQEIEAAKHDIVDLSEHSPGGHDSITWPLGAKPPYKPVNRYSVIPWTYFTETHIYLDNELTSVKEISGADKLDIADIKKMCQEYLNKKYGSKYHMKKIINGYRRMDPSRGMEYVVDILLLERGRKGIVLVKRFYLVRPLGKVELVPMPYVTESMMVNIILPLKPEDASLFDSFITTYASTCLQNREDVRLIVALLYSSPNKSAGNTKDPFAKAKTMIADYSKKYDTKGKLTWKALENAITDINVVDSLQNEFKTDVLILMTTVNMEMQSELTSQYLNRVRMNTVKGKQVFFPMGFWQYRPNLIYNKKPFPSSVEIGQRLGVYSTKSVDHASFYLSDYRTARKVSTNTVDLFSMFIAYKNFHVFRAVELNLKLKWMNLTCDPRVGVEKYHHCVTQNVEGLASQHHLALLIYEQRKEIISQSNIIDSGVPQQAQPGLIHPPKPEMANPPELKLHQVNVDPPPVDPQAEGMILVETRKPVKT